MLCTELSLMMDDVNLHDPFLEDSTAHSAWVWSSNEVGVMQDFPLNGISANTQDLEIRAARMPGS